MKKELLSFMFLMQSAITIHAAEISDTIKQVKLEEIVVSAVRVGQNAPVAHSNLNEQQIKADNAGKNLPYVLQLMPSVVAYSEGGTPIGNTSLRVRGTDATRINVTLNGMPINNPESQETFWVNLPDLSNSLQSVQVQRGVGTSTNGTASFGAAISLKSTGSRPQAYGEASTAVGIYNASISTIAASTGILKNGLSVDGRYSRTTGDGYIRNGKVDHKSGYVSLSHYTDQQLIKLIYINGIQHTGITWNGISPANMKKYGRRYNNAGQYTDDAGNVRYYDNETDNYYSNIVQALYTRHLTDRFSLNANFGYNNGYGYAESYKKNREFYKDFRLQPQVVNKITYNFSDVVRRKYLSNNFYMGSLSLDYNKNKLAVTAGGSYSYYDGSHYGKLPWVKHNQNISPDYKYYVEGDSKRDLNLFTKAQYSPLASLSLFGEVQYRYVDYRIDGIDDEFVDIAQSHYYNYFNPKVGASYNFMTNNELYASFGIANREPQRVDLKDVKQEMKSERLYDYEFGYRFNSGQIRLETNFYYMDYKDQMVQTGKLSNSGYRLQQNVPDSYRMGIEISAAYTPFNWLLINANSTVSRNKIKNYTAYYDVYENPKSSAIIRRDEEFKKSTDISYSPNITGSGMITVIPVKDLKLSLTGKYVGKMYFDNTSNKEKRLDDYFVSDFTASYTLNTQKFGKIDLQFFVYNIFDKKYIGNATTYGTYRYADGSADFHDIRLFPQATCNIMGRVGIRF